MHKTVIAGFVVLFILHQDFWFWSDQTLVFGFMPIGLAYHAAFSLAAGALWAFAVFFAWPQSVEDEAELPLPESSPTPDPSKAARP